MMENKKVELPEINDIITTEKALELCKHFEIPYLVGRIRLNRGQYKDWKFDGCSGLPDEILGLFTGCDWKDITYKCCLPHDLGYAYGRLGNDEERQQVDQKFREDLLNKAKMPKWCVSIFFSAVRVGGAEKLGMSFSWGFANIKLEGE